MNNLNQKPIFSIVIPMYNVSRYIDQAITSVLAQTYTNYEIICVDDGCTDDTVEIVRHFVDKRIKVVQQKNRGLAAARNLGINSSQGIFVAFLDADDYWHPEKLQRHLEHFKRNPKLGVSYCASLFVDEQGRNLGIGQFPKNDHISVKDIFCRNPVGNGSSPVIRQSVFLEMSEVKIVNGEYRVCYFNEHLRQSEDIDLWLRIALQTRWQFMGINKPLVYYRINNGGLSSSIENQLAAWKKSISSIAQQHPDVINQWYKRALAYQLRYLARRAIRSRNRLAGFKLVHRALKADPYIVLEEPSRTLLTYACAFIQFLPRSIYHGVERIAMHSVGSLRRLLT